ncbi:MAG: DsbA family protein [Gammaproteobacteria bacterium]|nr:DsbA family protein [Gammaproteobacteria bacterium]|tara:strand:+ start:939 stop:1589 length:651 start_codon:yes stop_codon:yes gene_type:complete
MTIAEGGPESILIYAHDPMCSWCYGFRPTWKTLKSQLPEGLPVVSLLGGLADDSDIPMPLEMVDHLKRTWDRIESTCKVPFNHSYWEQSPPPPRTTFISCRAVIAAERIAGRGDAFSERIQDAYYREAKNVWDSEVLCDLAEEFGFNRSSYSEALLSEVVRSVHEEQQSLVKRLQVEGYPSLLLIHKGEAFPISIRHGGAEEILEDINDLLLNRQA